MTLTTHPPKELLLHFMLFAGITFFSCRFDWVERIKLKEKAHELGTCWSYIAVMVYRILLFNFVFSIYTFWSYELAMFICKK